MAIIKCKMCGGDLEVVAGRSVMEWGYCGTQQTVPNADNEKKLTLFGRANRLRVACDFDKAAGVYESIVAEFPEEAEAYWGLVLCKYGIEYVDDPATGKKIPTCHRSSFDNVMDDNNFEQAMENADVVAQRVYREEAKQLERIRKGILEVSSAEQPYDIFICYKETDEKGDRTLDSVLAQDLYSALTDKGYRVFFSRITLQGKLGEAYEPYIFAALNSAKVMLAVGTRYEYYNAVWVKNEWSRYIKLCEADKDKHLIPCFKDLDPEDMPREFKHLQGADLGKMGAIQDILFNMEKYIPLRKQAANVIQEQVVVGGNGENKVAALLDRGNMALEDGDWEKADSFFEEVLNYDSKNAWAYLGKTLAQERCRTLGAFVGKRSSTNDQTKAETKAIPENDEHIEKAAREMAVAGYLDGREIREQYQYDLHYSAKAPAQQRRYDEEKSFWRNHRLLSRAEQFAQGDAAQQLNTVKERIFSALKENVGQAEVADREAEKALQVRYAAHLAAVDERVAKLRAEADERREADYQRWSEIAKTANYTVDLMDAAGAFAGLGEYRDSFAMMQLCQKRIKEIEQAESAEQERKQVVEAKLAARQNAKKKRITVFASLALITAIIAVVVVTQVVIPGSNYKEANELLASEQYLEAALKFEALGEYEDSAEKAINARNLGKTARMTKLKEAGFGISENNYPVFGRFEQDSTPGKDPIEWIPLDMTDDKVLLISRYALTCMPYSDSKNSQYASWDSSSIREWLNGDFLSTSFTAGEQSTIIETVNYTSEISEYLGDKLRLGSISVESRDNIFLLSAEEVVSYFGNDPERYTPATEYVKTSVGAPGLGNGNPNTWWVVRSLNNPMFVGSESGFGETGIAGELSVRPAMWVSISDVQRVQEEYRAKR